MRLQKVSPRWNNARCIVAATGPSLTPEVAAMCRGERVVCVNDAWKMFPDAEVLYAADRQWWNHHKGCPDFRGEKWSCGETNGGSEEGKLQCANRWGLNLVQGKGGERFSLDPSLIYYGGNSGFQAINLAILFGANPIILVGFNMKVVRQTRHFFGDHPKGLSNTTNFVKYLPAFEEAARRLPERIRIINTTPDTALTCFEQMGLANALSHQT